MRKLLAAILLLCGTSFATTPVTGNLKDLTGTAVGSTNGSFARFYLRGCGKNQPRVPTSTTAIAPHAGTNGIFFFDIPADSSGALSATVYSTRDAAGTGNGEIECGGSFKAVWYGVVFYANGVPGPETAFAAQNGVTLSLPTATPLSVLPVVTAPDGDVIYARLDGANQPFTGVLDVPTSITGTTALFSIKGQPADACSGFCPAIEGGDVAIEGGVPSGAGLNGSVYIKNALKFAPFTDLALSLGSATKRWNELFTEHLEMTNISTPATPASGTIVAYGKTSTKTLCSKDDAGVETCYGAGGGGGGAAGNTTDVQINLAGVTYGDDNFTYEPVSGNVKILLGQLVAGVEDSVYFGPDNPANPTKADWYYDSGNRWTVLDFDRALWTGTPNGGASDAWTRLRTTGTNVPSLKLNSPSGSAGVHPEVDLNGAAGSTVITDVNTTINGVVGSTALEVIGNAVFDNNVLISGRLETALETPSSSSAACVGGSVVADANFIYVCTAANTWKRAALSSF